MEESFDVIVVGARCAGSPLAASLAASGLRVCLVDRARFPSDVPSTHLIQPSGVQRLAQLGVLEQVLATGAPPLDRCSFVIDDVRLDADAAIFDRLGAPPLCVRRITLDSLLVQAAEDAGAHVRTQTPVVGLIEEDGVIRGVRTQTGELRAALVVGADGPSSSVARFVGAREYHVTAPGRLFLWAYFEHAAERHGRARLGKIGDLGYLAMPTDNGLFMAAVAPPMAMRQAYTTDVKGGFACDVARIEELAEVLRPATRVGPIRVMARWHGYFREATGPGWVLVGDAGHFKDPTPGQGISDALRQTERLTQAIEAGLGDGDLERHLDAWWRWRDDDAWDMYWFATVMGAEGPLPRMAAETLRGLSGEPDGAEQFMRVLNHDVAASTVFSPRRVLRTLARSATADPRAIPGLVSETATLGRDQLSRRRQQRRPEFTPPPGQSEPQVELGVTDENNRAAAVWGDQGRVRNWFHTKPGARYLNAQTAWFHVLAPRGFAVLTTTGRRSGRLRRSCVRAIVSDERAIVVAIGGSNTDWLRNVEVNAEVNLRMGRRTYLGVARLVTNGERDPLTALYCQPVHWFDHASSLVNQRSLPTRSRIRAMHRRWCREGVLTVIEVSGASGNGTEAAPSSENQVGQ